MTAQRLPEGALVLAGDTLDLVAYAVRCAQHHRARNGLPPSRALQQLAVLVAPRGQRDSPEEPASDPEEQQLTTREAADRLGISPRTVRRKAPELGGRLVGGRLLLDAHAVDEHRGGTE